MSPQQHETPAGHGDPPVGGWLVPDACEPMRLHEWASPIAGLRGPEPVRFRFTDRAGQQRLTSTLGEPASADLAITPRSYGAALARAEEAPASTTSWSVTHVPSGYALIKDIKTLPWAREAAHRLARFDVPWHLPAEQLWVRFGQREPAQVRVLRDQYQTRANALAELAEQADPALNRQLQATLIDLGASTYTGPAPTQPATALPRSIQVPQRTLQQVVERLEELPRTRSADLQDPHQAGATDQQRRILQAHPDLLERVNQPDEELGGDAQHWSPATSTAGPTVADPAGPDPWRPPAADSADPAVTASAEPGPAAAGAEQGGQVVARGPFYPALEGLGNVDLAQAAIDQFERHRAAGHHESTARREAAIAASPPAGEQDVTNMRYAGVTVADAAVERYLEYRAAGADRHEARAEATADAAAEHTPTLDPTATDTADGPGSVAATDADRSEPTADEALDPAQVGVFAREQYEANRRLPDETEHSHYQRVLSEYRQAHPDWTRHGLELHVGGLLRRMPEQQRPLRDPAGHARPQHEPPPTADSTPIDVASTTRAENPTPAAAPAPRHTAEPTETQPGEARPAPPDPPAPRQRQAAQPIEADRPDPDRSEPGQDEAARLDAAIARAEAALDQADTELARQVEPLAATATPAPEPAADTATTEPAADAQVGEVSL